MGQAGRVDQFWIAAKRSPYLPADLRALQRVRQPRAREVGLPDLDHLRLGGQPAQRGAVQDPGPVPLERAAFTALGTLGGLGREPCRRVPVIDGTRGPACAGFAPAFAACGPACAGFAPAFAACGHLLSLPPESSSATARPASSLATGTRNGEQET